MYYQIYDMSNYIFYALFGLCFILLLFKIILTITAMLPGKRFPKAKKEHKYAILVPARNECKVIRALIESIQNQTYNSELLDTYIIVESEEDPTCKIAKEYPRTHIIVRKHLELKGKGYALDEALQEILAKPHDYEAYFIFDADNILDPKYMEEMNKVYDKGYDMGLSYRNSKNWNDNWISACSGITFSIFSTFDNRPRSRLGFGMHVSGTGYYIAARVIEKLGGWKFFTLTEDYEITIYAMINNLKTTYNESAKFYDEQPTKMKQSWVQRMRWCKGYSQVNKKYNKELIKSGLNSTGKQKLDKLMFAFGVVPLVCTIITIFAYQAFNIGYMIAGLVMHEPTWYMSLISFGGSLLALYIFLMLYTVAVIIAERKNINLKFWNGVVCVLTNPVFMMLYLPIYIHAMCKKEVEWKPIEHTKTLEQEV